MLVIDVDYIESDFYCKINAFVRLMQISGRMAVQAVAATGSMNSPSIIPLLFYFPNVNLIPKFRLKLNGFSL